MLPRFLAPDLDPGSLEVVLPAEEAHHLARVLRLGPGAEVAVFDGRGLEYRAQVLRASRQEVRLALLARLPGAPAPRASLTLVQSILKGDAMDGVVRDATMVGVAAIQPVVSRRTTVNATRLEQSGERWRRIALSSAKQCGRSTLPEIGRPLSFVEWLGQARPEGAFLLVEPAWADQALTLRDLARASTPVSATLVVGPEGGWTPDEHSAARTAGCRPLSLGPLTLRADAVPLAAAAALLALWSV